MLGKIVSALICLVVPPALSYSAVGHLSFLTFFVIACGAVAFTSMGLNLFLAARWRGLDRLFGGLDQIYFTHKWIGVLVFIAATLHQFLDYNSDGKEVTQFISKLAIEAAEIAYPVLVGLVLVSYFKRLPKLNFEIPYRIWRWSHRLLGLVFIAIAFHQFFVKAPFTNNTLLANWLNIIAIIGMGSFLWSQLSPFIKPKKYKVTSIEKHAACTIVDLKPVGKGISARPGNFAFVSFKARGLSETHPFTVSQIHPDKSIQFSIRGLGDFTRNLRDGLSVGDVAKVDGGYGRFTYQKGGPKQIWVAAGIGITPFLAWADSLTQEEAAEICLIYCVRNKEEGVGLDRLIAASERAKKFTFILHKSDDDGRFDAQRLVDVCPFEVPQASFWFCGPAPMRVAIQKGLKKINQNPRSVHFERFEFR